MGDAIVRVDVSLQILDVPEMATCEVMVVDPPDWPVAEVV